MEQGRLFKTDKNGTKYYVSHKCQRCGGRGIIPHYNYIDGGVCYECNGSGVSDKGTITKEYTLEYKAKLEAKQQAKLAEEQAKQQAIEAKREADKQERIKAQAVKYATSNYLAEVGSKLSVKVKLLQVFEFHRVQYHYYDNSMTYIYRFIDDLGNIIVWNTSIVIDKVYVGQSFELKATVKEHKDYNGVKQTVVTNAKTQRVVEIKPYNNDNEKAIKEVLDI